MDLLEQYKQQHPEAFRKQKPARMADEYGREYTGMVAFVMRLSGGRIRTAQQASMALIAFAAMMLVISLFFFFRNGGPSLPSVQQTLRDTPTRGLRSGAEVPR